MRRFFFIFLGFWPLLGCSGHPVRSSASGWNLPFHYTDTEQYGMVVKMKILGPTERPGSIGDWIHQVKSIPADAIPVRAKLQDTVTVCVCLFNLCPHDLFIGAMPQTFWVEGGLGGRSGMTIQYPEPYVRLQGGDPYRDDSVQYYVREVKLPDEFSGERPAEIQLVLRWAFSFYRQGDPQRYWKVEKKPFRIKLVD